MDCRGDDRFRCGKTSQYICEVQKCDGSKDCPNGEDEVDCPTGSESEDVDPSGDGQIEEVEVITTTENTPIIRDSEEEFGNSKEEEEILEPIPEGDFL